VVVPVAVLALVAVALAAGCWWRRKGAGGSQPGSAKARDREAGLAAKPGEGYLSGPGSFPGARSAGGCLDRPVPGAGAETELVVGRCQNLRTRARSRQHMRQTVQHCQAMPSFGVFP